MFFFNLYGRSSGGLHVAVQRWDGSHAPLLLYKILCDLDRTLVPLLPLRRHSSLFSLVLLLTSREKNSHSSFPSSTAPVRKCRRSPYPPCAVRASTLLLTPQNASVAEVSSCVRRPALRPSASARPRPAHRADVLLRPRIVVLVSKRLASEQYSVDHVFDRSPAAASPTPPGSSAFSPSSLARAPACSGLERARPRSARAPAHLHRPRRPRPASPSTKSSSSGSSSHVTATPTLWAERARARRPHLPRPSPSSSRFPSRSTLPHHRRQAVLPRIREHAAPPVFSVRLRQYLFPVYAIRSRHGRFYFNLLRACSHSASSAKLICWDPTVSVYQPSKAASASLASSQRSGPRISLSCSLPSCICFFPDRIAKWCGEIRQALRMFLGKL